MQKKLEEAQPRKKNKDVETDDKQATMNDFQQQTSKGKTSMGLPAVGTLTKGVTNKVVEKAFQQNQRFGS